MQKSKIADIGYFGNITISHEWSNLSDFDDLGVYFDYFVHDKLNQSHLEAIKSTHHANNLIWPTSAILEISQFPLNGQTYPILMILVSISFILFMINVA